MKKIIFLLPLLAILLAANINAATAASIGFKDTDSTSKTIIEGQNVDFWVNVVSNKGSFSVNYINLIETQSNTFVKSFEANKINVDGNYFYKEYNTGNLNPGKYSIFVSSTDSQNTDVNTIDLIVNAEDGTQPPVEPPQQNKAPVLVLKANGAVVGDNTVINVNLDQTLRFDLSASTDADGDALKYGWAYAPVGQIIPSNIDAISSISLPYFFNQPVGNYQVKFVVEDSKGARDEILIGVNVTQSPIQPPVQPPVEPPVEPPVISGVVLGDLDYDGDVDFADFVIFQTHFGSRPGDINWNHETDFNEDNEVNFPDHITLVKNFGKSTGLSVRFLADGNDVNSISVKEKESFRFDIIAKDKNGNLLPFTVQSDISIIQNEISISGNTDYNTVEHPQTSKLARVRVSATDGKNKIQRTFEINVADVNRAPELPSEISVQDSNKISAIDYGNILTLTATDADSDIVEMKFKGNLPKGASVINNQFVWNIRANQGKDTPYEFTFELNDGVSKTERVVRVNVENTAWPLDNLPETSKPEAVLSTHTFGLEGNTANIRVSALNSLDRQDYKNELEYRYDFGDGNGWQSWQRDVTQSTLTKGYDSKFFGLNGFAYVNIKLQVRDLNGEESEVVVKQVEIMGGKIPGETFVPQAVQPPVQPPVQPGQLPNNNPVLSVLRNGVAAGNQIVINEGEALTLILQGSDPDNDILRFDAMNMPAGSNFNTNVFSWTPSNTQNGA